MSDTLFQAFVEAIGESKISRSNTERLIYARDLWPLHTLRLRNGLIPPAPALVVWPENEEDVIAILEVARAHKKPITPYGGGSGVLGGAMPSPDGIVMDMKRMSRLLSIDAASGRCMVEPGILGQHLEDQLNERGYTLGHFPSSLMTATVGGYVVTRSAGQFSSRYGKIEDMTLAMRFVSGKGEVFDTEMESLSSSGIDINQILLGSEGTLGVVTRVTLKLHPLPAKTVYWGIRFGGLEDGLKAMRLIMQAGLRPSVLRLYDEIDTFLVGKGDAPLPDASSNLDASLETEGATAQPKNETAEPVSAETSRGHGHLGSLKSGAKGLLNKFPQISRGAVSFALGRPALLESLGQRFLPQELLLILGFEGEPEEVDASLKCALELCASADGVDLGPEPGQRWFKKRYDVSFKMPTFFNLGAFTDTIEVASIWSRIPALYEEARAVASRHVAIMAHFSHAYPEGVSIYFSIGGRADEIASSEKRYRAAWNGVMEVVIRHGATVSHHHGVGKMKAAFVSREQAAFIPTYRELKRRLDPCGILNPGKLFVEGDPL